MILITGGSGQLSTLIANRAAALGINIITGSRKTTGEKAGTRRIDFDDPASLDFSGVETLFLVSAGYAEDDVVIRRHDGAISAAERQGVKQIVYTSLSGNGDHLAFALAHRWTENRLQQSSAAWTILRNGLYAELVGTLAAPADGAIRSPFGTGLISPVAREDLADVAVAVLADPGKHQGAIYELTGETAWSAADLAEKIGVRYAPATLAEARQSLLSQPLLPFQPPMLMSIYSSAAAGFLHSDHTDLRELIGTTPRDTLELAAATACSKE